ncbi:MAG: polysulfide reductase NrfD, partial [Akkermansia sp.]|nr:polysulfide reductase NrfD [Akkermansia sp.]
MMTRPAPALSSSAVPVKTMLAEVRKPLGPVWWSVFLASVLLAAWGVGWSSWRIAAEGVGVLGLNNNVVWGLDIVHFVFWIGLGHAGTLISAVLLLTRQSWRSPIARGAEQMTLCAVVCAAVFPVVHVGRVWMAWMASPLPEVSGIWPDMASPLMWDVMAVSTYFLLSLLYWYIGLVPDFALLRDCCAGHLRRRYGWLALGWQGTGRQWRAYEKASLLFAAILTPLVVSVHSVVSFDFSVTQV